VRLDNHRKVKRPLQVVVAALLLAAGSGCGAPEIPTEKSASSDEWSSAPEVQDALESEGPIEILDGVCCDSSIYSEVLRQVYDRAGAEVKVTQVADLTGHFPVVSTQENAISPSLWDFGLPEQFKKYVDEEGTVASIDSDIDGEEGWYVPTYMIEGDPERGIEPSCPGLPDWKALNDCVDIFKTAESGDKGAFHTAGLEWAQFYGDEDRIKNLGLNYEIVFTGSDAALAASIKRAYGRGEPIVALAWSPHYVTSKFDLTRIEFPPYSEECWGGSYACQWPEITLKKIMNSKFAEKHPTSAAIYENADLNTDDVKSIMIAMEEEGLSYTEAAEAWMAENTDRWQSWVPEEPVAAAGADS
jgi:glycine betaine/proline transport system substrate-binding protein